MVSLVIVEVSQEQSLTWDIAKYGGWPTWPCSVFAHLAVRRFAPFADPLLLPIVALLNGLGLVMIHRLDLAYRQDAIYDSLPAPVTGRHPTGAVDCGRESCSSCSCCGVLRDYRTLARYGYTLGLVGVVLLLIPACCPPRCRRSNGAKMWIRLAGILAAAR